MNDHNIYFDGAVQSIGFERNGRRSSIGVIDEGTYHFDTGSAERMTVVSGELWVKADDEQWRSYPAGTSFEVAANGGFDVRADAAAAYVCEYL